MTDRPVGMDNPIHWRVSDPESLWSLNNVGEAIPGVSTPLNWSYVGDGIELGARQGLLDLGVFSRRDQVLTDRVEDRFVAAFCGRTAVNVTMMRMVAHRIPGASANAVEADVFGAVRSGALDTPDRRRYPIVLSRLPIAVATLPRRSRRTRAAIAGWWSATTTAQHDETRAIAALLEARRRFESAFRLHMICSFVVPGIFQAVQKLVADAGTPGLEGELVTGYEGMEETELLTDLWECGHGRLDFAAVVARHGYHGPQEGQLATPSWREEPASLERLVQRWAKIDQSPVARVAEQRSARITAERRFLAGLGPVARRRARAVLTLAERFVPLREVGKAGYIQSLDGARHAARCLGTRLATRRALDDVADVFFLTMPELVGPELASPRPEPLRDLVQARRAIWSDYIALDLPKQWSGVPQPVGAPAVVSSGPLLDGLGVSPGVVTGRARVITDLADGDIEPDEILVCAFTDPSWAALFSLAAALVMDSGGTMSHGAIVSRELGIPCVSNTSDATRRIRTGDLVRVDGAAGVVTILGES